MRHAIRQGSMAAALTMVALVAPSCVPAAGSSGRAPVASASFQDRAATGVTGVVAMKATPSGRGLLTLTRSGVIHAYGDAPDLGNALLFHDAVALAVTKSGAGYWVFDENGCVSRHGDATTFSQSICTTPLNAPIIDAATTPSGNGYWLVAGDGGIFAFGDAPFYGSMGGKPLNAPIVGMAPAADGTGYWQVAADGGIFAFNVPFLGSMGGRPLNRPVIGMVASGAGYLMVGSDGGIFNFGNPFYGSLGDDPPLAGVSGVAPSYGPGGTPNGYWMITGDGWVYSFGSAYLPTITPDPGSGPTPPDPAPGEIRMASTGTYRVGVDIPAGTYRRLLPNDFCYWERLNAVSDDFEAIIVNNFGAGWRIVTIAPTDVAFRTRGCLGGWTNNLAAYDAPGAVHTAGVYRVGIDIAAGTWRSGVEQGLTCYWVRWAGFSGANRDSIAAGHSTEQVTVTVRNTDAAFEISSGCTGFQRSS